MMLYHLSSLLNVALCFCKDACIDSSEYGTTTAMLMRNGGKNFSILYGKAKKHNQMFNLKNVFYFRVRHEINTATVCQK